MTGRRAGNQAENEGEEGEPGHHAQTAHQQGRDVEHLGVVEELRFERVPEETVRSGIAREWRVAERGESPVRMRFFQRPYGLAERGGTHSHWSGLNSECGSRPWLRSPQTSCESRSGSRAPLGSSTQRERREPDRGI